MNSIADNIRTLRERHRFTQEFVAKHLNISTRWYGKVENEDHLVKENYLEKLALLYNMSVEEIKNFNSGNVYNQTINNSAENNNAGNIFNDNKALLQDLIVANAKIIMAKDETIAAKEQMISMQQQVIEILKNPKKT